MAKKNGLSKKIANNIPFIMNELGRNDIPKNDIMSKYFDLEGVQGEEAFGGEKDKYGRLPFGMLFASTLTKLKKNGTISSPKRSVYTLVDDSSIPPSFISRGDVAPTPTKVQKPTQVEITDSVETTSTPVEPTQDVEILSGQNGLEIEITDTIEVVSTPIDFGEVDIDNQGNVTPLETSQEEIIEVSVSNPAVIEAHIDTTTNELVENVGGSKDFRKSLDDVEDGYIKSNVVETTSTIETPVVETNSSSNVVETTSTIETTPSVEDDLLDDFDLDDVNLDEPIRYDLKQLIKDNAFDPVEFSYTTKSGHNVELEYLFYPDFENSNLVLTQANRDDYVIVNMDCANVNLDKIKNEKAAQKIAKVAKTSTKEFKEGTNGVNSTNMFVKCIASCAKHCEHTDDYFGFMDECLNPSCPLHSIFSKDAIYVQPAQ